MPRRSGETPTPRILVPPIGLAPVSVHTAEGQVRFPDGVHAKPPQTNGERVTADSRLTPGSFEYRRYLAEQLGVDVARVPVSADAQAVFAKGLRPVRETKVIEEKRVIRATVYRAPEGEQRNVQGKNKQRREEKVQKVRQATARIRLI